MLKRMVVVGHSYVAERQRLFAAELRRQLEPHGFRLDEVYPVEWGRHERVGGQFIEGPENMVQFKWPRSLFADWVTPGKRPSVVLLQQEAYCASAHQVADFCDAAGIPFVTFSWENLRPPDFNAQQVLASAAFNVFGNTEAMRLAHESSQTVKSVPSARLPQVGIDAEVYKPASVEKSVDVFFAGRAADPMKGREVLGEALKGTLFTTRSLDGGKYLSASEMAALYSSARLTCTPSRNVPGRALEQFAPAVNLESLFCETPVVTTKLPAITEWLHDAPGVFFAEPDDAEDLQYQITSMMRIGKREKEKWNATCKAAKDWAVARFSNEKVAESYVEILRSVAA